MMLWAKLVKRAASAGLARLTCARTLLMKAWIWFFPLRWPCRSNEEQAPLSDAINGRLFFRARFELFTVIIRSSTASQAVRTCRLVLAEATHLPSSTRSVIVCSPTGKQLVVFTLEANGTPSTSQ